MNTLLRFLTLITLAICPLIAAAEEDETNSYPNPHWSESKEACLQCHKKIPSPGGALNLLLDGDIINLCNRCHATISKDKYIHASGMVPPQQMVERMPADFVEALEKDPQGRVTCRVCHEIKYQCLSEEFYRRIDNPLFHRGAPYKKRTDLCYNCHNKSEYKGKHNPHDQINDEGELMTDVCTYCHDKMPDRRKAKSIADVSFEYKKLDMLCLRCHTDDAYAYGCVTGYEDDGSPIYHGSRPTKEMLARIDQHTKETILPMELVTGNIFCGTCHNPHELGVQRQPKADVGADAHKRLRISEKDAHLCLGCHDEKDVREFQLEE